MIFDTPATTNPIDQLKVIGQPADRVDGPRKVSGKAPYAYERHDMVPDPAYGVILGSAIAKGRIISIDSRDAESAPGVLAIVTADNAGKLGKASNHTAHMLAGRSEEHTSELQSLMRISYAVFCLKKKKKIERIKSLNKITKYKQHDKIYTTNQN